MAIIVKETGQEWELPPDGLHKAVCCDVVDLGLQDTDWGKKEKVELRWQIAETMADGKPYLVMRRFTRSLHSKSTLRAFLITWRGRDFTQEELKGFDLEKLIGVTCQVQIIYAEGGDGHTWANVNTAIAIGKGEAHLKVREYIRVSERGEDTKGEAQEDEVEEVPF